MRKIDKVEMGRGYQEMAEINLTVSQEYFHLEDEGANLGYGEMDTEETEGKAE
jgi:hypothetical protein